MTENNKTIVEKRTAIRLPFDAPLLLQLNNTTAVLEGRCNNMSGSGILVSIDAPIAIDVEVSLSLKDKPENFRATGEVVRLVEDGEQYLAAIKFKQID